jgi:hypothetical protein
MTQRLERALIRAETRFNHPYRKAYPGDPDTHWAPLSRRLCDFVDWLTGGRCHD